MNASKACIAITLFFSMGQGKNHVSYSSINAILKNLKKYHKINIKRRWLFCCLRWLLDEGYIKREPRYKHHKNGLIRQIPSMISFTLKGVVWLLKRGVSKAEGLYKSIITWCEKKDKRFPSRKNFDDGSWRPADPEERKRLEGLLGIVTKPIGQK